MTSFELSDLAQRYSKRLAIIVPYRDRAEHLAQFVPHLVTYFQRDKLDRQIAWSLHVVEQAPGLPFNRGALLNFGFMQARENADYFAFHDVDYLPIWADYSWSSNPARLIWHGLRLGEDYDRFFGAVVMFDKPAFERVNGFSNCYWGWGPEDRDLLDRCIIAGLKVEMRDGTYQALPHECTGFDIGPTGQRVHRPAAVSALKLYAERKPRQRELMAEDGLNSLCASLARRTQIKVNGRDLANSFHYGVVLADPGG